MKTLKIFIITTIVLLSSTVLLEAQTTQYAWEYVNTLQNEWLQKICTQGLDTVYIVGRNGLIAHSTDRALTWNKQYPVTTQLNDIIFCNHTTGFAVGNNGTILRTTDAGISWTQQNSGVIVNINAIAASSLDNIWTVGDNGTILFTKDGGSTWQVKDLLTTSKLNDISFRNGVGYIAGDSSNFFKTNDRGANWTIENLKVDNPYNNPKEYFNFRSINQTLNHVFCFYNGGSINFDNITNFYSLGALTSFTMENDSIGYGVFAGATTGSDQSIVVEKFQNLGVTSVNYPTTPTRNSFTLVDDSHSDIAVVNNTIGYFVTGNLLYKMASTAIDGINNIKSHPYIKIYQHSTNELIFESQLHTISSIEMIDIQGKSIIKNTYNYAQQNINLNISSLINGTNIINIVFVDGENYSTKWLKR